MLTLKKLCPDSPELAAVRSINDEAFPENEHVPVDEYFKLRGLDVDVLAVCLDSHVAGFLVLTQLAPTAYINYFAIGAAYRSKGLGGQVLALLAQHYPDIQIVVDFESVTEGCDNPEQRARRRAFYLRNGFAPTGLYMYYMETEFEVAWMGSGTFDQPAFLHLMAEFHRIIPPFDPRIYTK